MSEMATICLLVGLLCLVTCSQRSVADDVTMPNHWGSSVCQVSCSSSAGDVNLPPPRDCADLFYRGVKASGVYKVYVGSSYKPLDVYCDMETAGGGWLVFQRRKDGSVDFYKGWTAYRQGFGDLEGEFWLGNSDLHTVTSRKTYVLRIDMEDFENETRLAEYDTFSVKSEREGFELGLGTYSGTAGDSMTDPHNGSVFSTYDHEGPSSHCARTYKGGWWYKQCHRANLNGLYLGGIHASHADGVEWYDWHGHKYSLKTVEMKFRPADF